MLSEIVSLQPIYDSVRSERGIDEALRGNSKAGRAYGRICQEIASAIPKIQGFYLWGNYDKKKLWKNVYLGKAGFGKIANLHSRVLEEFKDERCCFWRIKKTEAEILRLQQNHYPSMWVKYSKNAKRSLRKSGSSHVTWVATDHLGNDDVPRVESDLIEALNPTANIIRPVPPALLQQDTMEIFTLFRENIHNARSTSFKADLFIS